ncbi:MAG: pyrroline-5-carboxylate reductase [Bacteroidota bacterium]|nr:pyrroline-5-carboxylate reductase [Candidatus Kapabacteria bacterium]MDW8219416.1 pyrroline-5-carboxylate reductase [Bacteroidota bacterium]
MDTQHSIGIIGGGNLGVAIAQGLIASGLLSPRQITITRRRIELLSDLAKQGIVVTADNIHALRASSIIILAVQPQQLNEVLAEICTEIDAGRHVIISVVSGASIAEITKRLGKTIPVVRAMPNTAIAIRESMTCLAAEADHRAALNIAQQIFNTVGATILIREEQMTAATALCACGIAFFLRAIRAASQGGIEIGFHADEAIKMAAQTARGAASLLLSGSHPESEIDKVTTPRGCTIAGLNEMEHQGFSSALIRGITTASDKATHLYA